MIKIILLLFLISLQISCLIDGSFTHKHLKVYPIPVSNEPLIHEIIDTNLIVNLTIAKSSRSNPLLINITKTVLLDKLIHNQYIIIKDTDFVASESYNELLNNVQKANFNSSSPLFLLTFLDFKKTSNCSINLQIGLFNKSNKMIKSLTVTHIEFENQCTDENTMKLRIAKHLDKLLNKLLPSSIFIYQFPSYSSEDNYPQYKNKFIEMRNGFRKLLNFDFDDGDIISYNNFIKNYIILSNNLLKETDNQSYVAFYYVGIANLFTGNYLKALQSFSKAENILRTKNQEDKLLRHLINSIQNLWN